MGTIPVKRLSYEKLRSEAQKFLATYHPADTLPVPIEEIIDNKLKLDIVPVSRLEWDHDTAAYLTPDMKEIRVDATDQRNNSNHYRFSLAHEAAHFVLHADVFRALIPRSIRDWKEKLRSISDEDYGWIEWQANALAGLILVPSHHLKSLLEKAVSIVREEGINVDDEPIRDFIAKVVGESFGVSGDVIARRLVKDAV